MAKSKKPSETPTEEPGTALLEQHEWPEDEKTNPVEVVAEKPAEVAKVEPAIEAKPVNKHAAWLTREAKRYGLNDEEIGNYTGDDLKEAVTILAATRGQEARVVANDAQSRQRDDSGRFVKLDETQATPSEFNLKELGIDTSKFDPDATTEQILTAALRPIFERMQKLEQGLSEFGKRDQRRELTAHYDFLDQKFSENESVFGKGRRVNLGDDSPELDKRLAVIGVMERVKRADPSLTKEEAFETAVKRLNYVAAPKAEPKAETVDADPHGYMNGQTIKPADRATKPTPKGTRTAEASVATILKKRSEAVDTTEHDELPD